MSSTTDAAEETGTGRRRALLIGVGRTPFLERDEVLARRFKPLDFVDRDIEMVRAALVESDYEVDALHPGHPDPERQDPDAGSIVVAVEKFLLSCEAGDTAFLYFSCHGVTVGEREYLLTSAAQARANGSLISHTILEVSPEVLLGPVPEGVTVVVCLDTCRTDDSRSPADFHETPLTTSAYRDVAWLHASGPGQPAYADPQKGSYFGIALSQALSRTSPPKTFKEVHSYVQGRVGHLTAHLPGPSPTVDSRCAKDLEDRLVLCRGSRQTERWARAVTTSVLWNHTSHGPEVHQRVKDRLEDLAREVAKSRLGTDSALTSPWSDPEYPIRVVERLGRLVETAGLTGNERLSPAETAALLAAPLMHEGVVAVALSELAWLRPDRLDKREEGGRGEEPDEGHQRQVCDEAADLCQAHSGVHHVTESLRQRKLTDAATAADHWLRHRFIADWDRLWDRTDDYPAVNGLLDRVVGAVSAGAEDMSGAQLSEVDRHVRRVLPHMTVPPGSSPRIDASANPSWSRLERPVPGNIWRAWELAYLLWLAALLAADPRRMSSVLVDHLGARRPLTPATVVTALAGCGWEALDRDGSTDYVLRLTCPHPALHAALEELAATADASVRALHRRWHADGHTAPDLLRGVPRKVTSELLKPTDQSYTVPLERFRLAEDEIRPLLMGTQLYGDRTLAVRELYQNALDACRHRRQRAEYGDRRKRFNGPDREPEIHFLQAYDGDRPYIECRDEGSGMSREKLTSMFARAGKRYTQDPDYVQERRNWRRVGMTPIPLNSRFGIGVFSYFMLADEVTVHTEAIDEYGNPSRTAVPLRATVQSGSGLLQIGPTDSPPGRGGTVVRLYLNHEGDEEDPPSVVTTLRRLLWVSDFRVTAVELGPDGEEIRSDAWDPGVLHASGARTTEWHGPAVKAGDESWIVQGPGQLLLDGIVVERAPEVFGYVFNLREKHRPEPSVNRNSLVSYDSLAVRKELLAAVPVAAGVLDEVLLPWLWELASEEPQLVVRLFDHLPPGATGLLDSEAVDYRLPATRLPLRRTGVLGMDFSQMRQWTGREPRPSSERAEAKILRRWRLTALGASSIGEPAFAPDRYPVPIGLDALLVSSRLFDGGRWTVPLDAALRAGIPLAASVRALRRYAIAGAHVPAARSIADLRAVGAPSQRMADLCQAYEVAALAAAAEPPTAAHVPLLTVATRHGVPPSRFLPDLDILRRLGVEIPDPGVLSDVDLTAKPLEAESAILEFSGEPWRKVHPVDLLRCAPLPAQRRRLAERITALEPLGLSHTETVREETLDHPALTPFERRLMSRDIDDLHPWLPAGRLTVQQLMDRSNSMSRTLGEVARDVARLAPATGVSAPEVPEECQDWVPPRWVVGAARSTTPTSGTGATHPSWRLLSNAHHAERRPSPEELRRELVLLDTWGCLADPVDALVEEFEHLSPALVGLLDHGLSDWSGDVDRWGFDAGVLRIPLFLKLAATNHTTLGETILDLMRNKGARRIPLLIPVAPEGASFLTPVHAHLTHLLHRTEHGESFREHLAIQDLLSLAMTRRGGTLRDAATVLDAYRFLGGPAAPGPITDALADLEPNDFDLAAFDPSLLGPGNLGPLELVLVAGRFGWTLGETYDRYAPFASLGLRVSTPEPQGGERDIVPGWRDVIVLTAQLTGRSPAVAGTVTDEHVVLCAEETEQSEDGVRDSLRSYARLFSLVVPTPGGPQV